MMATTRDEPRARNRRRLGLRLLPVAIILGGFVLAAVITGELTNKIGELREVPRDNVQWNTAQLEVDFLKMEQALEAALADPAQLDAFRKRYDIFYSRLRVLDGATTSLALNQDEALRNSFHVLDHFLHQTVALIDSSDAELRAALPAIQERVQRISDAPRTFGLGAVQVMARVSDAQREEIITILRRLAMVMFCVILAMLLSLAAMAYQRFELARRASEIAHAGRMRESTLRASLDAIVVIDDSGRITDFNGSAEKVFGYTREDILGKKLTETIVPHQFRDAHSAGFATYTTSETSKVVDQGRLELLALHKDGHEFPIEISISETRSEAGTSFVSYIRDITEEKLAKAELQKARDDALTATREKSRFFAVMSHEMRTALNGIMSSLNLLRDNHLSDRQERYVSIAESSSQVLLSHINDVLLIERLDYGEDTSSTDSFTPTDLICEQVEKMQPMAKQQNARIVTRHKGPDVPVSGNLRAIQQVIANLLSNAIKFTPSGTVTVETETKSAGAAMMELELRIADTGIGISKEHQARIFEDFVTVDSPYERSAEGTGLGLGIVRRLVQKMGGTVTCESTVNVGTTFCVALTLPRTAGDQVKTEEPEEEKQPAHLPPLNILVVEDNPINSEVLKAMLIRDGHKVSLASDGFEGVHLASRRHFDLILMDVSMPNMNGVKATQEIRSSRGLSKNAPIYAVTAHAMPSDVEEFLSVGMAGCISKPIKPAALHKALQQVAEAKGEGGPDMLTLEKTKNPDAQSDHIDHAMLGDLSDLLGPDRFRVELESFQDEAAKLIGQIAEARTEGNISNLQSTAHRLAGACGIFGAMALHRELQELETLCKKGEKHAALAKVDSVEETWEAAHAALARAADRL